MQQKRVFEEHFLKLIKILTEKKKQNSANLRQNKYEEAPLFNTS